MQELRKAAASTLRLLVLVRGPLVEEVPAGARSQAEAGAPSSIGHWEEPWLVSPALHEMRQQAGHVLLEGSKHHSGQGRGPSPGR